MSDTKDQAPETGISDELTLLLKHKPFYAPEWYVKAEARVLASRASDAMVGVEVYQQINNGQPTRIVEPVLMVLKDIGDQLEAMYVDAYIYRMITLILCLIPWATDNTVVGGFAVGCVAAHCGRWAFFIFRVNVLMGMSEAYKQIAKEKMMKAVSES